MVSVTSLTIYRNQADTTGGIYILINIGDFPLSQPELISLQNSGEPDRHFNSSDLDGNVRMTGTKKLIKF